MASVNGLLKEFRRALVLCPHTDDEFGCAGTIRRLIEGGTDVMYLAFSNCEASVPAEYQRDVLSIECRQCTSILGVDNEKVEIRKLPVRHFPEYRQPILESLISINREFAPDLVLLPSSYDMHQDHATVYSEGLRAFKHATLFGYEMPQNLVSFTNSAFVVLSPAIMALKIKALSSYASQAFRNYSNPDFVRGLACVRGVQCNCEYAEAFEVIRLIIT